ncbi:MAG: CPXCG motif-containing cysteine-rich protein [Gammaproteobacteria bacterium]|nr:CPXCG motif-containing cysteine-rich protein [Gammaproteobacteria bacterium]
MRELGERTIHCPYCGENIGVLIDQSVPYQHYIEDCQVCCRTMNFSVAVGLDGDVDIRATSDNE